MIIATAGHVDHGKTLLVKALTGVDADRLAEEKQRGLTIDLGFAYLPIAGDSVLGFVDVPGHTRFISNMLAGVAGIDCGLLVVAADDGPMPQTIEHLAILDLLGIEKGVVAITKTDRVDPSRVAEVETLCRELTAGTCLADAPLFPLSAVTGEGTEPLKSHLLTMAAQHSARAAEGHFRLAIDRCFTLTGAGVVVTGAVFAGEVHVGDELIVSPSGVRARVRRIDAQNRKTDLGRAGERCAINLAGSSVNKEEIHRGDWLVAPPLHAPTDRFDARIDLLPSESRPLRSGTPVHVHTGANDLTGRVALLDQDTIAPGQSGLVQLICERAVHLCRGDRLILRDQAASRTLGGGSVLDPFGPRRGRARPERIALLHTLQQEPIEERMAALLEQSPRGVNLTALFRADNLTPATQAELIEALAIETVPLESGGADQLLGLSRPHFDTGMAAVVSALETWHAQHAAALGPSERQLRNTLQPTPPPELFTRLTEALVKEGRIAKSGATLHLPGHAATLSGDDRRIWDQVQPILREGGIKPPVIHEMARSTRIPVRSLDRFLNRAAQLGLVLRVAENRCFLPDEVKALALHAVDLADAQDAGAFSASQYRDRTGIGRNLAIDVLEYFDRLGLTRREGDLRRMARSVDELF